MTAPDNEKREREQRDVDEALGQWERVLPLVNLISGPEPEVTENIAPRDWRGAGDLH